MIVVPPPRALRGREADYAGITDPARRIFTRAVLAASPDLEPWRPAMEALLREDRVAVVGAMPQRQDGPGELCARIELKCAPGAHDNAEYYTVNCFGDNCIDIVGASPRACFWGFQTVRQVLRQARSTFEEPLEIEDWPEFPVRGVLLDVSRNRIPTMEALKALVRLLSSAKINHLQLYMEHTFASKGHDEVWRGSSPFTAAELREIDEYCRAHFVSLVPCQATLGHMHRWLTHETYRPLAEVPDGVVHPFATEREPFSLCPTDERSFSLVRSLLDQLVPLFETNLQSEWPLVNINMDEPFDILGRHHGRTKGGRRRRIDAFYEYVRRVDQMVKDLGGKSLMWADAVKKKYVHKVPPDTTLVEWGYESMHPWKDRVKLLRKYGHRVFVAPGTSSWDSVAGRTHNALLNLKEAAYHGAREGASGYIITDWGDYGHHQQPCVSYIGYLCGAVHSWKGVDALAEPATGDETQEEQRIANWCDLLGFFPNQAIASAAFRLGNVYSYLPTPPNISMIWLVLAIPGPLNDNNMIQFACENMANIPYPRILLRMFGPLLHVLIRSVFVTKRRLQRVKQAVEAVRSQLLAQQDQEDPTVKELVFTADLLDLLADVWLFRSKKGLFLSAARVARGAEFQQLATRHAAIVQRFGLLWRDSSRQGGLCDSTNKLNAMIGLVVDDDDDVEDEGSNQEESS